MSSYKNGPAAKSGLSTTAKHLPESTKSSSSQQSRNHRTGGYDRLAAEHLGRDLLVLAQKANDTGFKNIALMLEELHFALL